MASQSNHGPYILERLYHKTLIKSQTLKTTSFVHVVATEPAVAVLERSVAESATVEYCSIVVVVRYFPYRCLACFLRFERHSVVSVAHFHFELLLSPQHLPDLLPVVLGSTQPSIV